MRLIRVTTADQLTDGANVTLAYIMPGRGSRRVSRIPGVILRTEIKPGVFFICTDCTWLNGGHEREPAKAGTRYAWAVADGGAAPLVERIKRSGIYGLSLIVHDRPQT